MAYVAPTPSQFKARFAPVFAAVDDPTIQGALDRAARMVDTSWTEGDYAEARMLLAAHDLTLEGVGASAVAAEILLGGTIKKRSEGDHVIEFATPSGASAGAAQSGPYGGTVYGRKFWMLLRQNKGGPRAVGGLMGGYSAAATDWPL
jgi:hypothetical protein